MIKIFSPIVKEIKTRIEENKKIHNMLLEEKEKIKEKRENKEKNIFRKITFVDSVANTISDKKDKKYLKKFEKEKKKELEEVRAERMYQYVRSKNFFALIGVIILFFVITITIGAINGNHNQDPDTETIIVKEIEKIENTSSNLITEDKTEKEIEIDSNENLYNESQAVEINDIQEETNANEENDIVVEDENMQNEQPVQEEVNESVESEIVNERMVWIPTNGGKKYHSHAGCSNMKNPQEVSIEQAEARGYTPCKKCN